MKLQQLLHEATDYDTRRAGVPVSASSEYVRRNELAAWLNDYVEDWREYGDIPKDTPNINPKDIPLELVRQVADQIDNIDVEDGNEDAFEDKRGDIANWALKQLNIVPSEPEPHDPNKPQPDWIVRMPTLDDFMRDRIPDGEDENDPANWGDEDE